MFWAGWRVRSVLISIFSIVLASTVPCQATAVTQSYGVFDVTFYNAGDSDGYANGVQDWTSEQMADVGASIAAWQNYIGNTAGRQINLHVFWSEFGDNNILGGSSSVRAYDGATIWNMGEYVWKEGGSFASGYGVDTLIQYDATAAGLSWNFGSGAPSSNQIDFRSVITHEIGHSLGWDSSYYPPPDDDWGWVGSKYGGLTAWDKNLVDSAGNRAESGSTGEPGNFNQTDNPVYFDGANATALYGSPVPIYAPATYEGGSSLVHLDEGALGDLLMSPFVASGEMIRTVSELEWAMMEDMGWTVIPEPATALLMLTAIGLIRNRKS